MSEIEREIEKGLEKNFLERTQERIKNFTGSVKITGNVIRNKIMRKFKNLKKRLFHSKNLSLPKPENKEVKNEKANSWRISNVEMNENDLAKNSKNTGGQPKKQDAKKKSENPKKEEKE